MTGWVLLLYLSFGNGEPPRVIEVRSLQECRHQLSRAAPSARGLCLNAEPPPAERRGR